MYNIPNKYWDIYFDEILVPHIKESRDKLFPELDENLCLEHYNLLHQTNYTQNEIKLNPEKCWVCKQIKDRP